jgi:carboxypeptidase Q
MRKTLLVSALACALTTNPVLASPEPMPVALHQQIQSVLNSALHSDAAYQFLGHLCNRIGPRLSGSPGAEAGVRLVADELRGLGLEVKLEPVTVPHWVRGHEEAQMTRWPGQPAGVTAPITLLAYGHSAGTGPAGIEGSVIVVDTLAQLEDLPPDRVAGKIVLFNQKFDKQMAAQGFGSKAYGVGIRSRYGGPPLASRLGARAALVRSVGGADYRLAHTGTTAFGSEKPIPAAAVSAEDADRIAALALEGEVRIHLMLGATDLPPVQSYNVVADLKGSQHPEEIVLVSGHLDSWDVGTGALDDGCGVAMAVEVARTLQRLHLRPARTLRVVAWMNEENGTAGGRGYAERHASEIPQHVAAIESDLGEGHPIGWEVAGAPGWTEFLSRLDPLLNPVGVWLWPATVNTGEDISPLLERKVPCFHPLVDSRTYFNYHHTQADTFDKIDPQTLRENCASMAALAFYLSESQSLGKPQQ